MKKSDLRKLKYRSIKNAYHDVELAKKAREWSEERIEYELGIKLPKTIPKLRKDVTEATKRRYKRDLTKYITLRDELIKYSTYGINQDEALKMARENKNKSINFITRFINDLKPKAPTFIEMPVDINPLDYYNYLSFEEKVKHWSSWSKKEEYPEEIEALAQMINIEKKLDKSHHLGYAVVYQAFIHNQDINILKKYFDIHDFEPEQYKTNVITARRAGVIVI